MKKTRRKFIGTSVALCAGSLATAASVLPEAEKYPIMHHVFFWLKNPDSAADRDKLIEGIKTLRKIESVKKLHVGIVAETEKRDVVDQSWSVSELLFFKDLEGQAAYQTHPIHVEFVKNYSHLWDKVRVYDTRNL